MDPRILAVLFALGLGCGNVLSQTTSASFVQGTVLDQLECINNGSSGDLLQTIQIIAECEEFLRVSHSV